MWSYFSLACKLRPAYPTGQASVLIDAIKFNILVQDLSDTKDSIQIRDNFRNRLMHKLERPKLNKIIIDKKNNTAARQSKCRIDYLQQTREHLRAGQQNQYNLLYQWGQVV
jgi:hypothetical protein